MTTIPDPTFPPLLSGHGVDADEDAFEIACRRAADGSLGAGDVVWSRNLFLIELAIVLEPEVDVETAVQMLPVAMTAMGDCIGALTPPQVGVTFVWPNVICINGAPAGEIRAAAAPVASDGEAPDWMVVCWRLRHMRGPADAEPGETPDITWLGEEGGGELTQAEIIDSYCRHFLTWLNHWNDEGFKPVHESWLYRAENKDGEVSLTHAGEEITGAFLGLDENGNLLVRQPDGKTRVLLLADCLEQPVTA